VLANEWASLDRLSEGRTIFVPCQGEGGTGGGAFQREFAAFGYDPKARMRRMEEAIEIMRLTSKGTNVSYAGEFARFDDVTIEPRPVQQPIPTWVTANPSFERPRNVESAYRRVAKYGDGWMTVVRTPKEFRKSLPMIRRYADEEGRKLPATFEVCLYYNINVNEDEQAAYDESKKVLDLYYGVDWSEAYHRAWTALGAPAKCAAKLQEYVDAGVTTVLLRPASFNCLEQYRRVTEEVLPRLT
jgi:alkanesulfonate monooxygenase SsuD/methylene tetrahydromethanopterin reductase-like flavin-dependent oxidoreductase (luciferase family)